MANPVLERDTDQDGIPDQVDLDSDGDGFSDLVEAGGLDIDNDGMVDVLSDTDSDGIPDIADASTSGGDDSDQDGIDDMFDVTFTGGNDADGDGIADQFDPDNDGNGFVGPSDDGGQGTPIQLPDGDGDGTPDIQESGALIGSVETGLDATGFGCSVSPGPQGPAKGPDPMLFLMLFASLASILWRTLRRVASRPAGNPKGLRKAGLVAAAASTLAITGCSAIGIGGGGIDRGGSDHKGRIYIGGGVLISELEPDASDDPSVSVDDTESAGGTLQLGYDISNRFSIEGHASELGEAGIAPSGDIGYQAFGLSGLLYLINDRTDRGNREGFNIFGRLGGGTLRNQGNGVQFERINDFHLLAGAGIVYGFRNGLGIRGEFISHDTDARFAQLGLVYRFGSPNRGRAPASRASIPTPPTPSVTAPIVNEPLVGTPFCALFDGVIEGINFESGSDRLTGEAQQVLSGVATTLQNFPDIRVAVEAHTDNQGSAASNLELSKRRAIAARLQPQAYGESQPRETNATADGRSKNRRVEFQVVQ